MVYSKLGKLSCRTCSFETQEQNQGQPCPRRCATAKGALYLLGHVACLALEIFQSLHHSIVVEDGPLHSTNRVQKSLLKLTKLGFGRERSQPRQHNKKDLVPTQGHTQKKPTHHLFFSPRHGGMLEPSKTNRKKTFF